MIAAATYSNTETAIAVTMQDGRVWHDDATLPPDNEIRRMLADWLEAGHSITPYLRRPPVLEDYRSAIQQHIDATAQQRGYDSGVTCASYVGSTNLQWSGEASAFISWRDSVWAHAYAELAKVQAGEREQPSVAEIIDELPAMSWPQ